MNLRSLKTYLECWCCSDGALHKFHSTPLGHCWCSTWTIARRHPGTACRSAIAPAAGQDCRRTDSSLKRYSTGVDSPLGSFQTSEKISLKRYVKVTKIISTLDQIVSMEIPVRPVGASGDATQFPPEHNWNDTIPFLFHGHYTWTSYVQLQWHS